jgi:2-keto-4-pentenoate hydratase/2-oxohepta-3-ene-1,7-dioic acid hydratase in catechol pathway
MRTETILSLPYSEGKQIMKLVTYNYAGDENVGVLIEDSIIPVNDIMGVNGYPKINSMIQLIERMDDDLISLLEAANIADHRYLSISSVKLTAPIPYPKRNVFCLGKNYVEHAREIETTKISETGIPDYPIYFTKAASPAIASGEQIRFSEQATSQVDYEVELAIIIGREGTDIKPQDAEDYIFGYTIVNDVSARDLQVKHKQWFKAKSLDTFCPMGPAIVHKNEVPFPVALNINRE